MNIWVDAQLPPTLANWLTNTLDLTALSLRELGLPDARAVETSEAARLAKAVIMIKDSDFVDLVCRLGRPPQILWPPVGMSPIVTYTNCSLRFCLMRWNS